MESKRTAYTIVGFDPDNYSEPVAVRVEQHYDRQTRSWVTFLVDEQGDQIGDAAYDGHRDDAAASKRLLERSI